MNSFTFYIRHDHHDAIAEKQITEFNLAFYWLTIFTCFGLSVIQKNLDTEKERAEISFYSSLNIGLFGCRSISRRLLNGFALRILTSTHEVDIFRIRITLPHPIIFEK